jgi:GNAT superfamily N-acetyltransferase
MLLVRRATADELPACAALYERVLNETFTWMPPRYHRAPELLRHALVEEVYGAFRGEALAGIAALYRPDNFLHSLYVDAAHRGRGLGKALLEHVARAADGPLSLKVSVPNLRARAFYLREGFKVQEEGRDPPPGVGWLRMSR